MDENEFKPMLDFSFKEKDAFNDIVFKQDTKVVEVEEEVVKVEMILPEALEEIKTNAYDEAYQKGFEQALQDVQAQKEQLEALTNLMLSPVAFIDTRVQNEVIQLSSWIAKAILKAELSINPQKILVIFNEISEILPNLNQIERLFLSSADHQIFYQYFERESNDFSLECLQIDTTLSQGEYRLDLKETEVDATVEARVQELVLNVLDDEGIAHE